MNTFWIEYMRNGAETVSTVVVMASSIERAKQLIISSEAGSAVEFTRADSIAPDTIIFINTF